MNKLDRGALGEFALAPAPSLRIVLCEVTSQVGKAFLPAPFIAQVLTCRGSMGLRLGIPQEKNVLKEFVVIVRLRP